MDPQHTVWKHVCGRDELKKKRKKEEAIFPNIFFELVSMFVLKKWTNQLNHNTYRCISSLEKTRSMLELVSLKSLFFQIIPFCK